MNVFGVAGRPPARNRPPPPPIPPTDLTGTSADSKKRPLKPETLARRYFGKEAHELVEQGAKYVEDTFLGSLKASKVMSWKGLSL